MCPLPESARTPAASSDTGPAAPDGAARDEAAMIAPAGILPECMRAGTPAHDARALTGGGSVAHVLLGGQVYVLRITRAGKLILTK